ncbi:MAG: 3-methyl-2-oxobutanoate hydroxymethyltransferase [Lentisphaerae bacterium]|nr:3-methyl-2-oxobutanoate hydroxymethyltransferase [Lentisphaerota bacterium]
MAKKLTVKDLLDTKGKRKLVLTTAFDAWTAKACADAGVDMIVTWGNDIEHLKWVMQEVRAGAPNMFVGAGLPLIEAYSSESEALRLAGMCRGLGVDCIYASGMVVDKFAALGRQRFPCCGHVGYLPIRNTWFGGPRAVGKTWDEALQVYEDTLALQDAGVIAVEMECVPHKIAAEITKRVKILTFSMGSGPDCDGQFLFACDLLGTNAGHYPRHSKTYGRLLEQATLALTQYTTEVRSGTYPAPEHSINMKDTEYDRFMDAVAKRDK